jgi:hypothetical protein
VRASTLGRDRRKVKYCAAQTKNTLGIILKWANFFPRSPFFYNTFSTNPFNERFSPSWMIQLKCILSIF